jgi:hypothetical protein
MPTINLKQRRLIEVVLRNDMASLTVLPDQPASAFPAWLVIVPLFDTAWEATDNMPLMQSGTIMNLPPGSYRVFAFDGPQKLEYRDPQAMGALAGKGQTVTFGPGGSAQVSVDVIATDSLEP